MAYTTSQLIRDKTGYTTSDISDADLTQIITETTSVINSEINIHKVREQIQYIDNSRQNKINGTNKTYYVQNSIVNSFGDSNDDGELTILDIKVETEDSDGNITEVTVNSIDQEGSFILETALSHTTIIAAYVTYDYTYYDITIPDKLIILLGTYLASSYAAAIVEEGLSSSVKFGNIRISNAQKNTSNAKFTTRYENLLMKVKIPSNKPRTKTHTSII